MANAGWSAKRKRQFQHIEEGLETRGRPPEVAREIAARTVNKERARRGEARDPGSVSLLDISSGRRGGLRSHLGAGGRTKAQLYSDAKRRGVPGRSRMTKEELAKALQDR